MAKLTMVLRLAILSTVSLLLSCNITIPVQFSANKVFQFTEKQSEDLAKNIHHILLQIDFKNRPQSDIASMCKDAYERWLDKRFLEGRVPSGNIYPSEYAADVIGSEPRVSQCITINFKEEYNKALAEGAQTSKDAPLFDLQPIRDKFVDNECAENFLDPDQNKIQLADITILVIENTLSTELPEIRMYTGFDLTEDMFTEKNILTDLIDNEDLLLLGESKPIPARFEGRIPFNFVKDSTDFADAADPINTLEGSIVSVISDYADISKTITVAGREYHPLPKGKIVISIEVSFNIIASPFSDGKCAFDRLINAIKEEEDRRLGI